MMARGLQTWEDRQLDQLRPKYPGWDIWIVPILQPPHTVWCARPKGTPVATINVDSPEALIEEIAAAGLLP